MPRFERKPDTNARNHPKSTMLPRAVRSPYEKNAAATSWSACRWIDRLFPNP